MTAIAISQPGPTTRLRLTVRGRRVVASLIAVPIAATLTFAAVGTSAALASRQAGEPADAFATVSVVSGDSLWSIAQRVAPGADPRDVVDALIRLNALEDARLVPGEELAVPTEYAPGR